MSQLVQHMKNVYQLVSFNVRLTATDYRDARKRRAAFDVYCAEALAAGMDFTRLNRVAHLLLLDEPIALQRLIIAANDREKDNVMIECSRRLLACANNESAAEACYVAAQCLNISEIQNQDTLPLQKQLSCKASTYCSNDRLLSASELSRFVNLRYHIQKRASESSPQEMHQNLSSLNVYQDITGSTFIGDIMKYLSVAQTRVLPFIRPSRFTNAIVGLSARVSVQVTNDAVQQFAKDCIFVIQKLRGCRQFTLALYMTYATDSIVQLVFPGCNSLISKQFDELSSLLLKRVISSKKPDIPDMALATACLLILGSQEGHKNLGKCPFKYCIAVLKVKLHLGRTSQFTI